MTLKEKLFNFFFSSNNQKMFLKLGGLCILLSGLIDSYLWFVWSTNNNLHIAYDMTSGYFVPSWTLSVLCFMNFILVLCILKQWDDAS